MQSIDYTKIKKQIKRDKVNDVIFNICNALFMLLVCVVTLYPFLNTLAVSFNDGIDSIRGGIYLWPRVFTWQNYKVIFSTGNLTTAFFISVARTVISAVLNVFLTAMLAYTITRKEFILRKPITLIFVLTMYFNAGLIPNYMLIKGLGLLRNFWVYILPSLVNGFNLIVIRTYMKSIPESLVESARIDGAGDFRIFLQIIFPLATPVLATIGLFCAVGAWNSWFDTFLYNSSVPSLTTLQYELMKLLSTSMNQNSTSSGNVVNAEAAKNLVTPVSIRAAITIVASVPILVVYPFLQKYFVTGLSVGSVKE